MEYDEVIDFLFSQLAVYQRDGASAYKPGLQTSLDLSAAFGDPHLSYKTIHIAGTNGKGSTAHLLASILQAAGYRTGLYTSPHLVDFRERIRVNGEMISKEEVIDFMRRYFDKNLNLRPSFFELTMMMAFDCFRSRNVDVAVIETGLGGRLDSTNIIRPELSVITNISFDHVALLGDTLVKIAGEKAGIIKPAVPVVIGEAEGEVLEVFQRKAAETGSLLVRAGHPAELNAVTEQSGSQIYDTVSYGKIDSPLTGQCQTKNAETVLAAVALLRHQGFDISDAAVRDGFRDVCSSTGLMGRWTVIRRNPLVVADTGHNSGGWKYTVRRLKDFFGRKRLVLGFVNDKDIGGILSLIADVPDCSLYLTRPAINRALSVENLSRLADEYRLSVAGSFTDVTEAYEKALADSDESDMVFVGGSNFVVADFLSSTC